MGKFKAQGTAWETQICRDLLGRGLAPRRLIEGGIHDEGDIDFQAGGQRWIIEARDRETMQVHRATEDAARKAGNALVAVVWKRKKKKPGNTVRSQVGSPVVIMPYKQFLDLMSGQAGVDE